MTEQELMDQLTAKLERLEAVQACRNLVGRFSYYHTAFRNRESLSLWANREDDLLVMPWGSYTGLDGVADCLLKDFGDRSDPAARHRMLGTVLIHEADTEVIEVAEDGKTAKGAWLSPGNDTFVDQGTPHAQWCWGKLAVDFIREDGQWYLWHMRIYPLFQSEYGKGWTETEEIRFPVSAKPDVTCWKYAQDRVYPANQPAIPWPYASFSDVGITFLDEED